MLHENRVHFLVTGIFLTILLCGSARLLSSQDASEGMWKDGATGLTWAVKDNGSSVNMNQAGEYCSNLRLGGFSDWRLPSIDELEAMYDKQSTKLYKIKGPIELSDACVLSATMNNSGEVWSFYFSYGGKSLGRASGHGSGSRALCVRQ